MQLKKIIGGAAAGALGIAGLLTAGIALAWVAGVLGISTATAAQVVHAIEVGGTALAIIMALFGGGIIAAIIVSTRAMIARLGRRLAIV